MIKTPNQLADAGYEVAESYEYAVDENVNFGKFGDVQMDKLSPKRAAKLVRKGFRYLSEKAPATASAKTGDKDADKSKAGK